MHKSKNQIIVNSNSCKNHISLYQTSKWLNTKLICSKQAYGLSMESFTVLIALLYHILQQKVHKTHLFCILYIMYSHQHVKQPCVAPTNNTYDRNVHNNYNLKSHWEEDVYLISHASREMLLQCKEHGILVTILFAKKNCTAHKTCQQWKGIKCLLQHSQVPQQK